MVAAEAWCGYFLFAAEAAVRAALEDKEPIYKARMPFNGSRRSRDPICVVDDDKLWSLVVIWGKDDLRTQNEVQSRQRAWHVDLVPSDQGERASCNCLREDFRVSTVGTAKTTATKASGRDHWPPASYICLGRKTRYARSIWIYLFT